MRREEEEEADGHAAVSQPRCEIKKILLDGGCQDPGEMHFRGMLLCGPHAALLGLEDRAEALLNEVYRMEEWMEENGSSAADEEFAGRILAGRILAGRILAGRILAGRIRHEREEAVGALRLTRAQLRSARKALSVGSS
jgi:hypothetical protein